MKKSAFSLLEILIALFIASIVMLQVFEGMRIAVSFLNKSRELMALDRTVNFTFMQLDKDLQPAFIPSPEKKEGEPQEKENGAEEAAAPKPEPTKEEAKGEQAAKDILFFSLSSQDNEGPRIAGQKARPLLNKFTFITTSPLQVYGQQKPRLARVEYSLKYDKKRSVGTKNVYTLIRKETRNLENEKFKEVEDKKKSPNDAILTVEIARMIKELSCECVAPKQHTNEKGEPVAKKGDEEELIKSFAWGEKKETKNILPQFIIIRLVVWDSTASKSFPFETIIPLLCFGEQTNKEPAKKSPEKPAAPEKPTAGQNAMQKPPQGGERAALPLPF